MMKKIETIATRSIAFMVAMIMSFLTLMSFLQDSYFQTNYAETVYYRADNIINNVVFLTIAILVLIFMFKKNILEKLSIKRLITALTIWTMIISGMWSYATYSVPRADSYKILTGIQQMAQGDYSTMLPNGYLGRCQNQLGITAYFEAIFRVMNGGIVDYKLIRVINIFMIVGIFAVMHLITKELMESKDVIKLELILSFGWFPLMMYSVFVYGSVPGLFFASLGILFMLRYLRTEKMRYGIGTALLLAIATIIKTNYLIFTIGVALILLVKTVTEKRIKCLIVVVLLVISTGVMSFGVTEFYESRSGIELSEGMPSSVYIAMGMQEGPLAEGWYNYYNAETYSNSGFDLETTDKVAKEYIVERIKEFLSNPKEAIRFYYKKVVSQWNEATYESLWITTHEYEAAYVEPGRIVKSIYVGKLHTVVEEIMNLYQLLIYFGTALYAWKLCREKDIKYTILILCVLGGFLFHMMWEGKSQYIFPYVTLMLPCAAIGITDFVKKLKKIINNK